MIIPKEIQAEFKDFSKRHIRKVVLDNSEIETYFSDVEAISICSGLKNSQARQVWKNYQLNKETSFDKLAAHMYAMDAVKQLGLTTVSFLVSLPPVPVGIGDVSKAFSLFENILNTKKHPCFRLVDTTGTKYSISFYYTDVVEVRTILHEDKTENTYMKWTEKIKEKKKVYDYDNLLLKTDNIPLVSISRKGKICPINEVTTNKPVVELLVRFFENPQNEFIYYGTTMGRCSNCDKTIFRERSLAIAVGPICARNLGLTW